MANLVSMTNSNNSRLATDVKCEFLDSVQYDQNQFNIVHKVQGDVLLHEELEELLLVARLSSIDGALQ